GNIGDIDGGVFNFKVLNGNLFVMGVFETINGDSINSIAMWNGSQWIDTFEFPKDPAATVFIFDMALYEGKYYLAGNIFDLDFMDMAVLENGEWKKVGQGFFGGFNNVSQLQVYKGELYACGSISKAAGNVGHGIQKWNGKEWSEPGNSLQDIYGTQGQYD